MMLTVGRNYRAHPTCMNATEQCMMGEALLVIPAISSIHTRTVCQLSCFCAVCRNATAQWMMGEALLVSPVVTEATTTIKPHFTAGAW